MCPEQPSGGIHQHLEREWYPLIHQSVLTVTQDPTGVDIEFTGGLVLTIKPSAYWQLSWSAGLEMKQLELDL